MNNRSGSLKKDVVNNTRFDIMSSVGDVYFSEVKLLLCHKYIAVKRPLLKRIICNRERACTVYSVL